MKYLFLSFLSLSFLASCNNSSAENKADIMTEAPGPESSLKVVPTLPSFSMVDDKGQVINLAEFKGKKVFVNLWATWCPPCRAEIPSIQKLQAKTDKSKTAFVMLSLDNNFETAKQFAANTRLDLPVFYPAANLPTLFNVEGIPVTFIFNEKGDLIHRQDGGANYNTKYFSDLLNQ